jgi:S-adenosylmethionine-diacylglycerol 3-amino-3-carboxypropyl transferase
MRLGLPLLQGRRRIEALFRETDLAAQRQRYRREWDTWRWRLAFRVGLSRPALRRVYGRAFLERMPADLASLMKEQVDAAFLGSPLAENGFLWQTFLGRYPEREQGLPLYLRREHHEAVRAGAARVTFACSDAAAWLSAQPPAAIGFFALSNILETAPRADAIRLGEAVLHAAKPGAIVCLRSILPPGEENLHQLCPGLAPDAALAAKVAQLDRSPFCRFVQIFRV